MMISKKIKKPLYGKSEMKNMRIRGENRLKIGLGASVIVGVCSIMQGICVHLHLYRDI